MTHAGVREVYLEGSPEQIGRQQIRLNYDHMYANEAELWGIFKKGISFPSVRKLLISVATSKYPFATLEQNTPEPYRRELIAEAKEFAPVDPFKSIIPTYQRMLTLHSLYDIALSFEHSPLIGCSTVGLGSQATKDGHVLLARAFDFEAPQLFDLDKAVYFVKRDGMIPFASVAWPGLIGVYSGMNREGVAVVVHGGRARAPVTKGDPVVFTLREVLEKAHDTNEAIQIMAKQHVMVSHIVILADAKGHFAVVERAANEKDFVRDHWQDPNRIAVTNHFEGPFKDDPRNLTVRKTTTTIARRARLDEMLGTVGDHEADVPRAVSMLRDHQCAGGEKCGLGDRRAIDPMIANHGIVADTTDRVLWVSAGPHLSGHFVKFDLKKIFAPDHGLKSQEPTLIIPADPILSNGGYAVGREHATGHKIHPGNVEDDSELKGMDGSHVEVPMTSSAARDSLE
ncbi:MAG: C45 family autoproteolytic acyltransferase/hydrolase [Bdellovibrionota bacterium]